MKTKRKITKNGNDDNVRDYVFEKVSRQNDPLPKM